MRISTRIVALYLVLATIWIIVTDTLLFGFSLDQPRFEWLTVGKGLLFVGVTAALLYLLISRSVRRLEQAERQSRMHAGRQAALAELGRKALTGIDPVALCQEACRCVSAALELPTVCVATLEEVRDSALLVRATSDPADCPVGLRCEATDSESLAHAVMHGSDAIVVPGPTGHRLPDPAAGAGFRGGLFAPIRSTEFIYGMLAVLTREPRAFTPDEIAFVDSVAAILGMTVSQREYKASLLRKSDELERIVDEIPLMVAHVQADGRLLRVNREWQRVFRCGPGDEKGGAQVADFLNQRQDAGRLSLALTAAGGNLERFVFRSGSGEPVETSLTVLPLSGSQRLLIGQNLTRLHELEAQLLQAQKMEAVGQLAGGVAHDFNNILTTILGHVELTLARLGGDHPESQRVVSSLEQINRAGQRAANLTRQLLTFSRRQVTRPEVVDLNALLRDMEKMLRRLLTENVELSLELAPDAGCVHIDPGQFEQVIMNLVVNARDALSDGGQIRISTASVGTESSRQTQVRVEDSGSGIPPEMLHRIFDPFFTTKPTGKGTGLGLAVSRSIVEQSGGRIDVHTTVGVGTRFEITFPSIQDRPAATAPAESKELSGPRGTETILLCEDDESVRRLTRTLLINHGYRVFAARDAEDALELLESQGQPPDLLLTDIIMPGMNGRALADEITRRYPSVAVLFMSGYAEEVIARHGVLEPGVNLLAKPFESIELLKCVRRVIDARRSDVPQSSSI